MSLNQFQSSVVQMTIDRRRSPEVIAKVRAARVAVVPPFEDRFWQKVERKGPDECWPWKAHVQTRGYGQFHVAVINGRDIRMAAHRVAYELTVGPVPRGLVLDHICKNTVCVNPAHLRPVTQLENCTTLARPSPFMVNKMKTHCVRGHPFDEANTEVAYRYGKPYRQCKACRLLRPSYLKKLKRNPK